MWSMTKKKSSEILADENGEFFREKVKFLKFYRKSKNISKIGGKSETGVKMHHGLREIGRPWVSERINERK